MWNDLVVNNGDKDVITQEQNEQAAEIAAELLTHGEVIKCMKLIDADAKIEERLDFDWQGIPGRCKPDLLLPKHKLCVDIKTTADATPEGFAKSVASYGYHRQQAFYSEAIKQTYGEEFRFLFAVVETSEPYNTAVYELDAASVDAGRQEINLLLDELERRTRDNEWTPEYSKGIVPLTLPKWYRSNIYEGGE
jgi:exodeoxyribonuclease VIII